MATGHARKQTLLHRAIPGDGDRAHWAIVTALLDARATQTDGMTALFYAAWAGDVPSTRRLLEASGAVSPRVERLWACLTPLHAALQQRHREVAAVLLEYGADVNAGGTTPDCYWPTPLEAAARWGTEEDVQRLLGHGADPQGS